MEIEKFTEREGWHPLNWYAGEHLTANRIRNWCCNGIKLNGRRVYLRHVRVAKSIRINEQDFTAFLSQCQTQITETAATDTSAECEAAGV